MYLAMYQFKSLRNITIIVRYNQYSFVFIHVFASSGILYFLLNLYASFWRTPLTIFCQYGPDSNKWPPFLYENVFISSYFLKIIFIRYWILAWQLFSFIMLKLLFYCLLTSRVLIEKLDVSLIDVLTV